MRFMDLFESIKVYHGAEEHGKRNIGHSGNNSSTFGGYNSKRYGWFFSSNPKFSAIYGEVVPYEIHLAPKQIINLDKSDLVDQFMGWLLEHYPGLYRFRNINNTWELFEDDLGEVFYEFAKSHNIQAVKFTEYQTDANDKEIKGTTFVLFNLNVVRKDPDPSQPDLFLK